LDVISKETKLQFRFHLDQPDHVLVGYTFLGAFTFMKSAYAIPAFCTHLTNQNFWKKFH